MSSVKQCIGCQEEKEIHKSQRCHGCFKKFDADRAKLKRENLKHVDIIKECIDCKEVKKLHNTTRCHTCFKHYGAEIMKKCREKQKQKKNAMIPENEKIPINHKKCYNCNEIKEIGDFYATNGNLCIECSKKQTKKDREEAKNKIIDANSTMMCKYCNIEKSKIEFRSNRKKCKSCENKERVLMKKNAKKENIVDVSDGDNLLMNNDVKYMFDKNEIYKNKKKELNIKRKERMKNDPVFKFKQTCLQRLKSVIQKNKHTDEYIGCDKYQLVEWMTFCMKEPMTIQNHGKEWHIDHVIPIDTFDLTDEKQQLLCFNWKNLSPETPSFNMKKGNKIIKAQILEHMEKLIKFHQEKKLELPHQYMALLLTKI